MLFLQDLGTWNPRREKDETACGLRTIATNIIGGTTAKLGDYMYTALLGYKNLAVEGRIDYLCGGSLINRFYVLTAAHCTDGFSGDLM